MSIGSSLPNSNFLPSFETQIQGVINVYLQTKTCKPQLIQAFSQRELHTRDTYSIIERKIYCNVQFFVYSLQKA